MRRTSLLATAAAAAVVGAAGLVIPSSAVAAAAAAGAAPAAGAAAAAAPAPASPPAASQPVIPADQTSPRGALKLFAKSVQEADVEKVRGCLHAAGETEGRYARGYADVSVAFGRLRAAVAAKFGEEAAKRYVANPLETQHIDEAAVREQGDVAVVELKTEPVARIELVRVDGQWKLSVNRMLAGRPAREIRTDIERMALLVDAVTEVATETFNGQFKTAPSAMTALEKKVEAKLKPKK